MTRSFAEKLRLIMRVTGCDTQKALYAQIKAVNPETCYDPARAYKWIKGRSNPRNSSVYDDLVRLLGLDISGEELRTCSYDRFYRRLSRHYGDQLPAVAAADANPKVAGAAAISAYPPPAYLVGRYVSFSRAWSPHRPGCLVCGETTVTATEEGVLDIDYVERLPWGDLQVVGTFRRIGRNLTAMMFSPDQEYMLNMTYALPPPPGTVMLGIISGVTLQDAEMRPIAARIASFRLPDDWAAPERSGGYLNLVPDELSKCLVDFGMDADRAADLAPDVMKFLAGDGDRGLIEAPVSVMNAMASKILGAPPAVPDASAVSALGNAPERSAD
ncbi:hypothetical protein NUH88_05450 [Nisaea acidiphila]|uniref:Uncharacterized protein n=1 Tax=Nisaea acidiphila TaxID=1862145 RepID=A0A9J7AVI6_9PROT|nr:hypothetical protein [Nisaea acidiphila]UUX51134.1 hypothetical protein NUH88_05450 [Nisaea acidiphila]